MRKLTVETKVGVFFVAVFALIAWISTRLGDYGLDTTYGMELSAVFSTASGVNPGVYVNMAGIRVGSVDRKVLDGGKARVYFDVLTKLKIPDDSKISILTHGFLGQRFLEIIPGTSTDYLESGDEFYNVEDASDISGLTGNLEDVSEDIKEITGNLRAVLGGEEGEESLRETFEALNTITVTIAETLQANQQNMDRIMANFERFTTDMAYISNKNRDDISRAIAQFPAIAENLNSISGNLAGVLDQNDEEINQTLENLVVVTENLGRSMEAIANIAQKVDEGEGTLGKLVNDDSTIKEIHEAVEGINDYVQRVRRLQVEVGYRGEYHIEQTEVKSYFNINIRPNFDKVYMLSIIDAPTGRTREQLTETVTTTNPGAADEQTETEVEHKRVTTSELLFSAQIGKRWHDVLFRGGIIESHGGAGIEFYLFNDHLNLAFEAFDFSASNNPHLKASMNAYFLDHFLVTGGIDDFINRYDDPRYSSAPASTSRTATSPSSRRACRRRDCRNLKNLTQIL
ncbi:MAG: MlaD family protein [Deltaproteobacteria bacterium]|nr:MlaD family protein [Deltaproteobacteria bacterium]